MLSRFETFCLLAALSACRGAQVEISVAAALARTDATRFASFSFDLTNIFGVERTFFSLNSTKLRALARNLAPSYVRFGGSFQDRAVSYFAGTPLPPPAPPGMLELHMNETVFDEIVDFCTSTGLDLVYGLNAAVGRQLADGSKAPWDAANALAPLQRAAALGQRIPVVELGNEVNVFNCSKDGAAKMSPAELASQYATLAATLRRLFPGARLWGSDSSITGDRVGQCWDYYGSDIFGFNRDLFAQPGWASLLDAHTWHYYSQDSRNASSTAALVLSPEYQARLPGYHAQAASARDAVAPGLPLVMGETASFWAGGRANVSNRFASGFWYLPQLGFLASKGYLAHIRQDLAGGDYGLLDLIQDARGAVVDFSPNPDYFLHALWQQLMGGVALGATVTPDNGSSGGSSDSGNTTSGLRAWAACGARAAGAATGGVTVLLVNFDAADAQVAISLAGTNAASGTLGVYQLTPGDDEGLASATMRLNGELLEVQQGTWQLPDMLPRLQPASEAVTLPPLSFAFLSLPEASAPACI